MISIAEAVSQVMAVQKSSGKPVSIVVAGHNGSGKSSMWNEHLSNSVQIPLINADRMMMSILPEVAESGLLPGWASDLRDQNQGWMRVAQKGVEAFVAQAMTAKVAFAMETVFSHWVVREDGFVDSKIRLIEQMQRAGYFVILLFVGLASHDLSILRVKTRISKGGHAVDPGRLVERFPRTQRAIAAATGVADAAILMDNSREPSKAFTVCRVEFKDRKLYDLRDNPMLVPAVILAWLDKVSPRAIP